MRRGHFDTKDAKSGKGTKKSYGAFAAEQAGNSLAAPKTTFVAFSLFASFVSKTTLVQAR